MHTPDTTPRPSVFYEYKVHPFRRPPELQGGRSAAPVAIVGAGPIGMLTALNLARFGVASILLEQELQVSLGSRAIVLTRRSMEILQHAGVAAPFLAKGLPWSHGRSFYKGREVYRMVMPHDPDDRFMPGLNIQQQYIEQYLVEAVERSALIDLRWGSQVTGVAQDANGVTLKVDTPEGEYDLATPWVVAADGGRSPMRRLMGLRMEGRSYAGNFVIADIKADLPLPTERLCHFDPPWNPGNNVLVHREPDGIWRLDFRLPDGETPEQALEEKTLAGRIELILEMIGHKVPWVLDWATVYSANTLTLADYVAGRVIFTGDAAHLLPIFGVRGANTGFQDGDNLAWKLAAVVKGEAGPKLLPSYSGERVLAAREICDEAGKSTRFMTPPTAGFRLMRDAVLSFSLGEDFAKDLLHWRTSRPHVYSASPLNSYATDDALFWGGPQCGAALANVKLSEDDYLFDRLRSGFHLMLFAGADIGAEQRQKLSDVLAAAKRAAVQVVRMLVLPDRADGAGLDADVVVRDGKGTVAHKYGARPGTAYLVRPDTHVCARWLAPQPEQIVAAVEAALGRR